MSEENGASPFSRPGGTDGSFEPLPEQPPSPRRSGPAPSYEDAAAYGGLPGQAFEPAAGDRLRPNNDSLHRPVPRALAETYHGSGAFDPAPGDRLTATKPGPGSPWWKPDASTDPWRDPQSPFWIAGPPVYADDEVIGMADPVEDGDDEDTESDGAKSKGRRARLGFSAIGLGIVIALLAGVIGGGIGYWLNEHAHNVLTDPNVKLAETGTPANRPPGSVADIAKRVSPAVVSIDVRTADAAGSGSGVVIDKRGYILTNNHVVAFASNPTIRVVFSDQSSAVGKVVGTDPVNDLAVVKVDKTGLTVASLGNSDSLVVGDPVIAIGDPLGLRGTVTNGIVSSLKRPLRLPGENGAPDAVIDAIQTNASINPGNSGGALVAADGSVVGINTAIASLGGSTSGAQSGSIGIGFAIPINHARTIAQEIITSGKVKHADLGASSRAVTDGTADGAYLVQIVPNGPAAKAGLKEGDVVVVYNKELITSGDALTVAVSESQPGSTVTVRYVRNGVTSQATITLGTN